MLGFGGGELVRRVSKPYVPVQHESLSPAARRLAKHVKKLGTLLPWVFLKCGTEERFIQAQLLHERLADIAIDLYVSSCVVSRLDRMLQRGPGRQAPADYTGEIEAGKYFLDLAARRIDDRFRDLFDNDDSATVKAANAALARY
jgi:hypothetical protein